MTPADLRDRRQHKAKVRTWFDAAEFSTSRAPESRVPERHPWPECQ
jgi:hypothetical protein